MSRTDSNGGGKSAANLSASTHIHWFDHSEVLNLVRVLVCEISLPCFISATNNGREFIHCFQKDSMLVAYIEPKTLSYLDVASYDSNE